MKNSITFHRREMAKYWACILLDNVNEFYFNGLQLFKGARILNKSHVLARHTALANPAKNYLAFSGQPKQLRKSNWLQSKSFSFITNRKSMTAHFGRRMTLQR
ncbi:hypothetical protein [Pseudomonas sp. GL-B-26]|uniref:hypothetical protein n=1 Tax=Pseudomonas sp. GL-B-26 TaxID=2832394 RepID=UPI001CC15DB6|nr:hypothetical protein [Pseudomonas sp. GL-B-26]